MIPIGTAFSVLAVASLVLLALKVILVHTHNLSWDEMVATGLTFAKWHANINGAIGVIAIATLCLLRQRLMSAADLTAHIATFFYLVAAVFLSLKYASVNGLLFGRRGSRVVRPLSYPVGLADVFLAVTALLVVAGLGGSQAEDFAEFLLVMMIASSLLGPVWVEVKKLLDTKFAVIETPQGRVAFCPPESGNGGGSRSRRNWATVSLLWVDRATATAGYIGLPVLVVCLVQAAPLRLWIMAGVCVATYLLVASLQRAVFSVILRSLNRKYQSMKEAESDGDLPCIVALLDRSLLSEVAEEALDRLYSSDPTVLDRLCDCLKTEADYEGIVSYLWHLAACGPPSRNYRFRPNVEVFQRLMRVLRDRSYPLKARTELLKTLAMDSRFAETQIFLAEVRTVIQDEELMQSLQEMHGFRLELQRR